MGRCPPPCPRGARPPSWHGIVLAARGPLCPWRLSQPIPVFIRAVVPGHHRAQGWLGAPRGTSEDRDRDKDRDKLALNHLAKKDGAAWPMHPAADPLPVPPGTGWEQGLCPTEGGLSPTEGVPKEPGPVLSGITQESGGSTPVAPHNLGVAPTAATIQTRTTTLLPKLWDR